MKEHVIDGRYIETIMVDIELESEFAEYNSVRWFVNGNEVLAGDIEMIIYNEEGEKMGATYNFEHELGKKVWIMLDNVPTEVEVFEHLLTASMYTYTDGLCMYRIKYGDHINQRKDLKAIRLFNSKAELIGRL